MRRRGGVLVWDGARGRGVWGGVGDQRGRRRAAAGGGWWLLFWIGVLFFVPAMAGERAARVDGFGGVNGGGDCGGSFSSSGDGGGRWV